MVSEPLPHALEYGEVLITILAAPINPADIYNVKAGATPSTVRAAPTLAQRPPQHHTFILRLPLN